MRCFDFDPERVEVDQAVCERTLGHPLLNLALQQICVHVVVFLRKGMLRLELIHQLADLRHALVELAGLSEHFNLENPAFEGDRRSVPFLGLLFEVVALLEAAGEVVAALPYHPLETAKPERKDHRVLVGLKDALLDILLEQRFDMGSLFEILEGQRVAMADLEQEGSDGQVRWVERGGGRREHEGQRMLDLQPVLVYAALLPFLLSRRL